jgi:hypothetical protein
MTHPTGPANWFDRVGIWVLAAATAIPLAWCLEDFRALFWFGDDWDLLNQISQQGFRPWVGTTFAENFVPLFKILWGAAVHIGGGSYFFMVCALWATHMANTWLLARLLRRGGLGVTATVLASVIFGLESSNIESLAWAVQWSSLLSTTFFLAAALVCTPALSGESRWTSGRLALLAATVAASALSFSRGILTGLSLGIAGLFPGGISRRRWILFLIATLVPPVVVAAVIATQSSGNHRDLLPHLGEAFEFGLWIFAFNPLFRLLDLGSANSLTLAVIGFSKVAVIVLAFAFSTRQVRCLLLVLLLVDLGNAALLGIGCYHTGLPAALSFRYQYAALLCTAPFLALAIDAERAVTRRPALDASICRCRPRGVNGDTCVLACRARLAGNRRGMG